MALVYCHTSPSGKRYIGVTTKDDPNERWRRGLGYGESTIFGKAIRKYGWDNFKHEVIKYNISLNEANELEKYYIQKYNTTDSRFGYNMQDGGNVKVYNKSMRKYIGERTKVALSDKNNKIHKKDEMWLQNISISLTGRKVPKEIVDKMVETKRRKGTLCPKQEVINRLVEYTKKHNYNKGKHLSEETKKKISESKTGTHVHTLEYRLKLSEKMKGNKYGSHCVKDETREKLSKVFKGRKWLHNDFEEIRVYNCEIDAYIDKGYMLGRKV